MVILVIFLQYQIVVVRGYCETSPKEGPKEKNLEIPPNNEDGCEVHVKPICKRTPNNKNIEFALDS